MAGLNYNTVKTAYNTRNTDASAAATSEAALDVADPSGCIGQVEDARARVSKELARLSDLAQRVVDCADFDEDTKTGFATFKAAVDAIAVPAITVV